jgi:hypothetical protein
MDNIFDYLPIIVAALVFLFRLFSKKAPEATEPTNNPTTEQPNSFEDLLKQITKQINETKEQTNTTQQENKKLQNKTITGEVIGKEKGLSEAERKKDQHFKPYEVKKETKKQTKEVLTSKYTPESQAKEVFKGEKGLTKQQLANIGKSSAYQIHKKKENKFASILKNKDTFKNALIINELINRKHF